MEALLMFFTDQKNVARTEGRNQGEIKNNPEFSLWRQFWVDLN